MCTEQEKVAHFQSALCQYQAKCLQIFTQHYQLRQEKYLLNHPEIKMVVENVLTMALLKKPKGNVKLFAAKQFGKHVNALQRRGVLENFTSLNKQIELEDILDNQRLRELLMKARDEFKEETGVMPFGTNLPFEERERGSEMSSSFVSIVTSETTIPTPDSADLPQITISKEMLEGIEWAIIVAGLQTYDEEALLYDTAYVFTKSIVEAAMEVPVASVKKEVREMLDNALNMWELDTILKENIVQAEEYARRERKPIKKLRRILNNFKGYAEHEEKFVLPKKEFPVKELRFNRYPKDDFGVYEQTDYKIKK